VPTRTISANTTGSYVGNDTGAYATRLLGYDPDSNKYSDVYFEVTTWEYGSNDWNMAVLWFDLSGIPSASTITAVELGIYLLDSSIMAAGLRELLRNHVPSQVTWNSYSTGNAWTAGGGIGDGTDRTATLLDTVACDGTASWKTFDATALITLLQDKINAMATNVQFHLQRSDGIDDGYWSRFSNHNGADGNRPYLRVTYTESGGTSIVPILAHHLCEQGAL
jgi:hypothetical protein